jgi:hypothetical protein
MQCVIVRVFIARALWRSTRHPKWDWLVRHRRGYLN